MPQKRCTQLSISKGERILLDTGFFVALHNTADRNRDAATEIFDCLKELDARLYTSDYVLDEAVTVAYRRTLRQDIAIDVGHQVMGSKYVTVLYSDKGLVNDAFARYKRYSDKALSFTDCLLISLAQREKMSYIVTFDNDFDMVRDGPVAVRNADVLVG